MDAYKCLLIMSGDDNDGVGGREEKKSHYQGYLYFEGTILVYVFFIF